MSLWVIGPKASQKNFGDFPCAGARALLHMLKQADIHV